MKGKKFQITADNIQYVSNLQFSLQKESNILTNYTRRASVPNNTNTNCIFS